MEEKVRTCETVHVYSRIYTFLLFEIESRGNMKRLYVTIESSISNGELAKIGMLALQDYAMNLLCHIRVPDFHGPKFDNKFRFQKSHG